MAVECHITEFPQPICPRPVAHAPLVLVVDDDQELCDFLTFVLRTQGYRVSRARDGVEAIEKALYLHPDLVLMDLCLPRLDGCSAIQRLKADERTRHIRTVALTGYDTFNAADDRARKAGCDAFLTKPLEIERLLETIRHMVSDPDPGGA
jgi:two-component system cell cycle response regulator DivK